VLQDIRKCTVIVATLGALGSRFFSLGLGTSRAALLQAAYPVRIRAVVAVDGLWVLGLILNLLRAVPSVKMVQRIVFWRQEDLLSPPLAVAIAIAVAITLTVVVVM